MTRIIKAEQSNAAPPDAATLHLKDFAQEARAIVLDARKEAARIATEARDAAEEIKRRTGEEGYCEGFARGQNDGYADGHRRAQDEGRQRLAADAGELVALAGRIVRELADAREELMHQARQEMLELALELAEKIVGRVAAADIQAALANLTKVLELAGGRGEVVVRVHPGQLEQLRRHCAELVEALSLPGVVRLVGDEKIEPGGVKLVTSGGGEIDATIRTQLRNVVDALVGAGTVEAEPRDSAGLPAGNAPPTPRSGEPASQPLGSTPPSGQYSPVPPGSVPSIVPQQPSITNRNGLV